MEGVPFPGLLSSSLGAGASRAVRRRLPAGGTGTGKRRPNVQPDFLYFRARTGRPHGQLRGRMGGHRLAPGNVLAGICDRIGCGVAAWLTRAQGADGLILQAVLRAKRGGYGSPVSAYERAGAVLEGELDRRALERAHAHLGRLPARDLHASPPGRGPDVASPARSFSRPFGAGL